tara:strand:+ start:41 stop:961 length:921 start_codon:yes stop_codon:yes gene_type:complete
MVQDTAGNNQKNIMKEIYKDHFERICNNELPAGVAAGGTNFDDSDINLLNIGKSNNIKFEMVLGEKLAGAGNLTPVLLISFFNLTATGAIDIPLALAKPNIQIYAIAFDKLGEKNTIEEYIKKAQQEQLGNKFPYVSITLPPGPGNMTPAEMEKRRRYTQYNKIHTILSQSQTATRFSIPSTPPPTPPNNNMKVLNLIFYRLLYTFKSIGDHGQVNFAKELKELDTNDQYEVIFVTGDSLAALYASIKGVTNVCVSTISDFPSKFYCKSNPANMIFYGNILPSETYSEQAARIMRDFKTAFQRIFS